MNTRIWKRAIDCGDAEGVKRFTASGGDLDVSDLESGMALVHGAVARDRAVVLEALAALGADLDVRDANGSPALHHAIDLDLLDESTRSA